MPHNFDSSDLVVRDIKNDEFINAIISDLILRQLDEGSNTRKVLIILTDDELRTHSLKNGLGLPVFSPAEIGQVSHQFQMDGSNLIVSDWLKNMKL